MFEAGKKYRTRDGSRIYSCIKMAGVGNPTFQIDGERGWDWRHHDGRMFTNKDNRLDILPEPVCEEETTEDAELRKWAVEQLVQAGGFSIDCFDDYSNMLIRYVKEGK